MTSYGFESSALEDGFNGQPSLQDGECNHPVKVVWWNVLLSFVLFLANCVMSMYMSLGISKMLVIAGIRSIIQLLAVGYILKPLFATTHWEFVALYACFMLWITAVEGMSRPSYSYAGMLRHIAISILGGVVIILIYGMLLVIQWVTEVPWWEPQYFIPIGGMLLGNSLSGISLALKTVLEELATGQDRVEVLLAVGATRFEATKGVIQRSLNTALVPQVTQMSIVGIVSIPGMMTGQILAGADPVQAALYQIAILFLITTATALGSVITVFLAITYIIDKDHRLRSERLRSRDRSQGIEVWAMVKAISFVERLRNLGKRMYYLRQRSWNAQNPNLRNWGYARPGEASLEDSSLGAVILDSEIGSDEILPSSAVGLQMETDGDGITSAEEIKLFKK